MIKVLKMRVCSEKRNIAPEENDNDTNIEEKETEDQDFLICYHLYFQAFLYTTPGNGKITIARGQFNILKSIQYICNFMTIYQLN